MTRVFQYSVCCMLSIWVAAYAGSPVWTNVKDYGAVGDGITNDTTAIRGAIAVGGSRNATIYFPPGIYRCGYMTLASNRTLRGENATLKCIDNLNTNWIVAYQCKNVTIQDLTLDGNKANNTLTANTINYTASDLLTIGQCDNLRVINCTLVDSADSGIMLSQSRDCSILGNHIKGGTDVGIYVNNDWTARSDKDANALSDCIISNNTICNFPFGGIALKRVSRRVIISDNAIHHCGNGITLEQASYAYDFSKEILITGNQIRYIGNWTDQPWYPAPLWPVAGRGINLRCGDYCVVTANRIDECYAYSIMIEGSQFCTVSGNVVRGSSTNNPGNYQIGLYICERAFTDVNNQSQTLKTQNCTVTGNVFANHSDYGILEPSAGGSHNVYSGNMTITNGVNRSINGIGSVQAGNN